MSQRDNDSNSIDSTQRSNHVRKKKRSSINPLAAARPKSKSLESIWHVKSGAGYQLFVDYYQAQPMGVTCSDDCSGTCSEERQERGFSQGSAMKRGTPTSCLNPSHGLSRASKRRKKKRGDPLAVEKESLEVHEEANLNDSSTGTPGRTINHRLLSEVNSAEASSGTKALCFCPSGFMSFIETLTKPLPVTFRLRSHLSRAAKQAVMNQLASHLVGHDEAQQDKAPVLCRFTPTLSCSKMARESGCTSDDFVLFSVTDPQTLKQPQHTSLAAILQQGTADGTLARQEYGSLLPVSALRAYFDSQSRSPARIRRILDLCSAPGSKTLQLVEWMMERHQQQPNVKPVVIKANDVNPRRLEELKEAIHRSGVLSAGAFSQSNDDASISALASSAVKIKYTNQDASRYADTKKDILYDVILADVPCSGDGTVRKDARVLPYWTPRTALDLHGLQLNILCRALQLLAVDGIVVYSTCSLSPIENEAVVAGALRRMNQGLSSRQGSKTDDSVCPRAQYRLLQVKVPDLISPENHRPGVLNWKVADYVVDADQLGDSDDNDTERACLTWYETYEQAQAAAMKGAQPSMWPQLKDDAIVAPLQRCLRLWPQDNDTGGFFVSIIQRTK